MHIILCDITRFIILLLPSQGNLVHKNRTRLLYRETLILALIFDLRELDDQAGLFSNMVLVTLLQWQCVAQKVQTTGKSAGAI